MPPRKTSPDATDHDLLIEIRTRLDVLQSSVRENNAAVSMRLDHLQNDKANSKDLDPLRTAIERHQADLVKKAERVDLAEVMNKVDSTRRLVFIGVGIVLAAQVTVVPAIVGIIVHLLTR